MFKLAAGLIVISGLFIDFARYAEAGERQEPVRQAADVPPDKQFKVVAQGLVALPAANKKQEIHEVITDRQGLARLFQLGDVDQAQALICNVLKVKSIDFKTQMLIVVAPELRPGTGLLRVEVTRLGATKERLKIGWDVWTMETRADAPPVPAKACVALIDKFEGPVEFARPGEHGR